jgi:hypothetical protein
MIERWIVFGGWDVSPEILLPLFGKNSILIDSTGIAPSLVRENALAPDWIEQLDGQIRRQLPDAPFFIAGWSMGKNRPSGGRRLPVRHSLVLPETGISSWPAPLDAANHAQ